MIKIAFEIWTIIGLAVETFSLIGLIVWIFVLKNKKRYLGLEPNQTIIWNFDMDLANGHTTLLENKKIGSTRDKESYAYYPLDVYYSDNPEADESNLRTQLLTCHIQHGLRFDLPKNSFSNHRNHGIYLPRDPNRIATGLKNTLLGQAMTSAIIFNKLENDIIKLTNEGYTNAVQVMEQAGVYEASSRIMKQYEKMMLKLAEQHIKEKTEGTDQNMPTK